MVAGVSATIGFAALTQLPAVGYSPLLIVVILVGFGGAGTAFGSIVLASRELADGDQGLAGGVVNTSRQIGAAVGAALLPAVAESVAARASPATAPRCWPRRWPPWPPPRSRGTRHGGQAPPSVRHDDLSDLAPGSRRQAG